MSSGEGQKAVHKQAWSNFAPLEIMTTMPAARLVKFAGITTGRQVLDVACGTGVVAITAARAGARVTGFDLTPELLERARHNAQVAGVEIEWHQGTVEKLPFAENAFDVVTSQYGHMFAPHPDAAISEMLRVLKPGGTIAFSTWPPDLMMGRLFSMRARYGPPPPPEIPSPVLWGDQTVIRERLGDRVRDITFESATMLTPALSPQHFRHGMERSVGPVIEIVETLSASDPAKLEEFRREHDAIVSEYFRDNTLHQVYLMTRATKR